jgi:carboxyl-terminal processing protease
MSTRYGRGIIALMMLTAAFFAGYLVKTLSLPAGESTSQKEALYSGPDSAISRYLEALAHVRHEAVFLADDESVDDLTVATLKAYLAWKDSYSDFLTPQEYDRFKEAGSHIHASIGLDIEKRRNGEVLGYPIPGGPAARAGIRSGERLLAIDGTSVTGKSIPAIVALAVGRAGTEMVLEVEGHSGPPRQVAVARSLKQFPAVSESAYRSLRIIKLASFAPETKRELGYILSRFSPVEPVIIDLRSCGGGDFQAAVDAAMLFLKQEEPIVSVETRSGTRSYSSTIESPLQIGRMFLWQDELTASAAEIFIAALVENGRATSIGRLSAGKGTRQDVIELTNGGALVLTTGYLITPRGIRFDGKGLDPVYPIEIGTDNTYGFFSRTEQLIKDN